MLFLFVVSYIFQFFLFVALKESLVWKKILPSPPGQNRGGGGLVVLDTY